jgi:hypothetical protein
LLKALESEVLVEVTATEDEQLLELETEFGPPEDETLQLLAFTKCVGDLTPGIRIIVNKATMENANLCTRALYKAIIYIYCKIILRNHLLNPFSENRCHAYFSVYKLLEIRMFT